MKAIGIKLADGSFYPLLEEGNSERRSIDLTTVMDNQTKVKVEVYSTETGSLEGAEYLDTLEIEDLNPRKNGDPTLSLVIDMDKNNKLSAEIRDIETGKAAGIQVKLGSETAGALPEAGAEAESPRPEDTGFDFDAVNTGEAVIVNADTEEALKPAPVTEAAPAPEAATATEPETEPAPAPKPEASAVIEPEHEPEAATATEPEETAPEPEAATEPEAPASDDDILTPNDFDLSEPPDSFPDEDEKNSAFEPNADIFKDLYDKETIEGTESRSAEDSKNKKSGKTPMIICIICAIICIIAVLLILFVIPSPLNICGKLFGAHGEEPPLVQETTPLPPVTQPSVADSDSGGEAAEPQPEAEAPAAKEDEIVVAPTPEEVVPEPPEVESVPDIRYKIVWGDTLWDICDAYYRNPWRYRFLAEYNHIRNPDLIISGTWLLIPQDAAR